MDKKSAPDGAEPGAPAAGPLVPDGKNSPVKPLGQNENAFAWSREFFGNRFVYAVVSPRARGLSLGVNMNPDQECNFDCVYCEVERGKLADKPVLDTAVMAGELRRMLELVRSGGLRLHPRYGELPPDLLQLRHVALSGDGEPTLCPNYREAFETVIHARAQGGFPFFKIVLITNATGLDREPVLQSLNLFTSRDEIWVKLEAGTQAYMDRVNRPKVPLDKVMANIQLVARQRPVIIQSLFPLIDGETLSVGEIIEYINRLLELKDAGAKISLVQIYSATRPIAQPRCGHLPLKQLFTIARMVREQTGLPAEVF